MRKSLLMLVLLAPAWAARPPFTVEDIWGWRTASDPRISPDGGMVAYIEGRLDRAGDARYSSLWLVFPDGRERQQWSKGPWRDYAPRWSATGKLAWISDRGRAHIRIDKAPGQVRIPEGGEAGARLDTPGLEPIDFSWSPAGDRIAFTARIQTDTAPPAWAPPALLPFLRRPEGTVQIFVAPVAGGTAARITAGNSNWPGEPAWMADGETILAVRDEGEIQAIRVADRSMRTLAKGAGRFESVLPSGDGARIAYLFTERKPQSYTVRRLFVMNADGTRVRPLAGTLDRDAASPQWSSDSRTVYFLADDRGATRIYAARNDGSVRQVNRPPERLRGFSLADNGRAVAIHASAAAAEEVVTFTVDTTSQPFSLASPNAMLLAEREIGAMEEIGYPSEGRTIQAWLVKPPGFDRAKKYPLLVDVADDPRSMYGVEFRLRAQIFAARGFVVLCANPRGTPGYGEPFGHLLHTRYPGDDFDDLMRGVDFAIAQGYVDAQRVNIAGGLVTAWALGRTDRFRAAVARRPIADWVADIATSPDGLRRAREWMGAMPWDDPDQYVKHSPIYFAQGFHTPTLVLAGDADAGSEELYFGLQARKVESALVRVPGGRPSGEILEMEAALAWLEGH